MFSDFSGEDFSVDDSKDRLNSIRVPGVIDFGYEYNDKHQLTSRKELYDVNDKSTGFTESFTYDNVNRLKTAAIDGTQTLNMVYATDKIKTKSDVGEYDYNNSNHQITELDAVNGYNPPNHILTYTAEGKVDTLRDTTYHKTVTFTYGTDNERFKSEYTKHDTVQYTRYYFDTYEKETLKDGTTRNLDYIYSGDNLIAIHVSWGNADTTFFVYTDYLGSLRCITDSAGNIRQRLSFDAWGNRRNPLTGAVDTTIAKTLLFARGYTGHEHLDELGLINMNGRVYDPALGMFISADNYVQAPDNTQNFNRYAYCVNNPLMYSDPSGELIWIIPSIGWSKSQGVNIGVSLVVGLPGGLSVQAGIGYSFKSSDAYVYAGITAAMNTAYASYSFNNGASVGYTSGLSQFSGLPINTNFLSIGVNYNISNNNVGGNFSAWQFNENGISFDPSISVMVFPEQTTNFIRSGKFINNDAMLKSFTDVNDYQGALNYFGFEATYDPNVKNPGQFNPADNIIRLNKVAFSKNYNFLQAIYAEELFHSQDYLYAQENTPADMLSHEYEEWRAQNHLYKNQGLYSKSGIDWVQRINYWGMQAGVYDMYTPLFSQNWWHFIYKLPRKW
jgi:RHS repeat-associated protein